MNWLRGKPQQDGENVTADGAAVAVTRALISGDAEGAHRLFAPGLEPDCQLLLTRFAEEGLWRWFGAMRALAAPGHALPSSQASEWRYVVGKVTLPDGAMQDYPILTLALGRLPVGWQVVRARANPHLFADAEDDEDDPTLEPDLNEAAEAP